MRDESLATHPEASDSIRRVILGGIGVLIQKCKKERERHGIRLLLRMRKHITNRLQ